ncbi:MAG: ethanolamine utilization protein EutN [Candidatus Paceibacteria bacterium]|jgi:ethanolamine utilization protein EutN
MFLADVVGTLVAPIQIPELDGEKLLILRMVLPDGTVTSKTRVAIDRVGAGEGDRVLVLDEGNGGRQIVGNPKAAIKTVIVGVVDFIEQNDKLCYEHGTTPRPTPLVQP